MLSVIILSVIYAVAYKLSINMLSIVVLNVIMLNVVAPLDYPQVSSINLFFKPFKNKMD